MAEAIDNDDYRVDSLDDDKFAGMSKSQARALAFKESLTSQPPCCPECNKVAEERDIQKCIYCGFHYGYLEKLFPRDLPTLNKLNDFSKSLSSGEQASLNKSLLKIKKKYPQVLVKLVILPLQPDVQIQQMALWMHNECPLPEGEEEQDRLWTILLLIDTRSKSSCYVNGYKVEVFWTQDTCADSITSLNYSLKKHPLVDALENALESMLVNLDHSKRMVRRQYRKFKKRIK